jgi:hypothetical protein
MITNFEEITQELTERELKIIPFLIGGFSKRGIENPVKAPEIIKAMNNFMLDGKPIRLTEPRLRKCVNYIRTNSLIPLMATSKGYFTTHDKVVIESQIRSLNERAASIKKCATGLGKFL